MALRVASAGNGTAPRVVVGRAPAALASNGPGRAAEIMRLPARLDLPGGRIPIRLYLDHMVRPSGLMVDPQAEPVKVLATRIKGGPELPGTFR